MVTEIFHLQNNNNVDHNTLNNKLSFLITLDESLIQFRRGIVSGSGVKVLQTTTAIDRFGSAHSLKVPWPNKNFKDARYRLGRLQPKS